MASAAEIWAPISQYEGLYEVSTLGRVRSLPRATTSGKILKPHQDRNSVCVTLSKDNDRRTKRVHSLVAISFLGSKPADKDLVAHWDGDFTNNALSNLRWATFSENEADKRRHDRHAKGERNPSAKLTKSDVAQIRNLLARKIPYSQIARIFPIGISQIGNIKHNRCWNDAGNAKRRMSLKGKVFDSGKRRKNPNGRDEVVWSTHDPSKPKPSKQGLLL